MVLTPDIFAGATTFILGNQKRAGKTTLLNYILRNLRGRGPLAYLGVGADPGGADLTTAMCPRVVAAEGDWLLTAQQVLQHSDVAAEIHEVFAFPSALGPLALVRVLRGGTIELVGPGNNTQLAEALQRIRDTGIDTILVDGAINRITPVGTAAQSAFIYVLRVDCMNLQRSADTMRLLTRLQEIPVEGAEPFAGEGVHIVEGALTGSRLQSLDHSCRTLILKDFAHVFLTHAELVALLDRVELRFRARFDLRAFVVNLHDVPQEQFLQSLNCPAAAAKVVFNPFQEAA